ncbi:MAG: helix-turn-helix transcriptional regulator [Candidatus Aminicenantaceae bacterium]
MHISSAKIRKLCRRRGFRQKDLLFRAGVSKSAFYHLLYKESILPKSIHAMAAVLEVRPSDFLEEISPEETMIRLIARKTDEIIESDPTLDRENVRHTLLLLQEEPIARLRRALTRGQKLDLYR